MKRSSGPRRTDPGAYPTTGPCRIGPSCPGIFSILCLKGELMNGSTVLLLAGILSLNGCVFEKAGPVLNDFPVLERDDSEVVRVNLHMGAGDLRVGSGTQKLMRADFAYNVPGWKPEVHYSSTGKHGTLRIEQPSGGHMRGNVKYEWDVRLNREVAIDLEVHF